MPEERHWIDDVELGDVKVKWAFSHFAGEEDRFNGKGDHNFMVILPDDIAEKMRAEGWNIRTMEGYEEGDPPEHLLKIKISFKYEPPKIYFITEETQRRMRVGQRDLADIRRDTARQIDVVITPSRWVQGANSGITAYARELYVKIKYSRFALDYQDYAEIGVDDDRLGPEI